MSCPPFTRLCWWLLLAGAFAVLLPAGRAQTPLPAANAAPLSFCSPRTVLWLGRTAVLPFHAAQAAAGDSILSASCADSKVVEIVRDPVLLSGETTGYLRVRAVRPGRTRLTLQGFAGIDLEVQPDPSAAAFAPIDVESARPRIVSPMPDAAVWGQFAVGVEVFDAAEITPGLGIGPAAAPSPSATPASSPSTSPAKAAAAPVSSPSTSPAKAAASPAAPMTAEPTPAVVAVPVSHGNEGPTVRLHLPNGQWLDPVAHTGPEFGPVRHYQFNVPADELPAGSLSLVAVSTPTGFSDVDRRAGRGGPVESEPLPLRNLRNVRSDALLSGECESPAILGPTKDLYAPARPARFGTRQPDTSKDAAASGGMTVYAGNSWCMPVVIKEPGEYGFFIQARGDFAGGAFATASLFLDNSEVPLGSVRLTGTKYQRLPVGSAFHLDAGPQVLTVAFRNGFGHGKENRTLALDRFELARLPEPIPAQTATAGRGVPVAPVAAAGDYQLASLPLPAAAVPLRLDVLYPAVGATVSGVDAVVGRLAGPNAAAARPAWVDVLIDGQPQNVRLPNPSASAPMVFPLLARQIPPGTHRLALRAADAAGLVTDSPAQPLNVQAGPLFSRGPYERAVYLLDRLGFGAEPSELAAVLTMGESRWLDARLSAGFDTPAEQALLRVVCKRYPNGADQAQTIFRALDEWIASDNPVRSRFTAWAENHFSTWMNKIEGTAQWRSHLNFCRVGVAPFGDLLSVSAHSPAMLVYLDQAKSYANNLNENYAREIMELHTLGVHGGYSQTDVTALAGVLNGWTIVREGLLPQEDAALHVVYNNGGNDAGMIPGFRFVPVYSDGKSQRVFGMQFPAADPATRYDRVRLALEMLVSHPSTAEHVCRKLADHYVGDPAPDGLVHRMAGVYLETGGDMRAVLRAMVAHPAFWSATPKMATPFDYGVRIARLCRASVLQMGGDPEHTGLKAEQVEGFLKKSGMGMFDRVTPDGYPQSDDAYADSNALLQRWHFMEALPEPLARLVPKVWRTPPNAPAAPTVAGDPNPMPPPDVNAAQRFIDLAAVRLTGRLLTPRSNQAALDVLGQGSTPEQYSQAILFVSLLPETSLR